MSQPVALQSTGFAALDEIAEVIGQAASFKLWEEFIGETVSFPIHHADEPRLAKAVGPEIAASLCEAMGGQTVQFPIHPISAEVLTGVAGEPATATPGKRPKAIFGKIVAMIGEEGAYKLACEFRGERFRIPADHTEEPRLSHAIGPVDAARLCETLHGRKAYLGKNPARPRSMQQGAAGQSSARAPKSTGSTVLDEIFEVIGEDAGWKLAEEFIGQRLYIPKDPATDPRIAKAIGDEMTAKLCSALWRTTVSIPTQPVIERLVAQLASQGRTKNEICRALHITERQVYRVLQALGNEQR